MRADMCLYLNHEQMPEEHEPIRDLKKNTSFLNPYENPYHWAVVAKLPCEVGAVGVMSRW